MIIVNGVDYYNVVVIQDMHRMGEHAMYGHRQGVMRCHRMVRCCDPTIIYYNVLNIC